ncbi:MAG: rhodanese-like domain-containing protein, partial [Burkholderiales bacterium]
MDQLPDHTPDPSLPATTATDLLAVIGTPSAPLVVDVRRAEPYGKDPHTIATSLRVVPEAVAEQARAWPRERPIVVFCVHGHKVSQAACRTLLDAGLQASYLAGGMDGWVVARGPTMRKGALHV